MMKTDTAGFFLKTSVFPDFGPNGPKMAQNGQNWSKMVVNPKFLENGSNDFSDFWHEVTT